MTKINIDNNDAAHAQRHVQISRVRVHTGEKDTARAKGRQYKTRC